MMRSLFAGVSGLRNHQTRMDVIGNNIANVNTVGFKASRGDLCGGLRPAAAGRLAPAGRPGRHQPDPDRAGLQDRQHRHELLPGQPGVDRSSTDLAIQGDGLFVVSDGQRNYYTRAGNFQLDANGRLVSPANGFKVQGINADSNGVLSAGNAIREIALPFGQKSPARATSSVTLTGNLDAREKPQGHHPRHPGPGVCRRAERQQWRRSAPI